MHFKRGLKLWSINTDFYLKEAQKLYNDGYFDFCELSVLPNTFETLKEWKKLKIPYIIHNPHYGQGFCLSKKEYEAKNLEIYKNTKIFADELEAKYIIFHGGIGGNIDETIKQLNLLNEKRAIIENKPKIVDAVELEGVDCIGYHQNEIEKIIDETNCGFCLDFGHAICAANAQKKDIFTYIDKFLNLNPSMFHLTNLKDISSPYDSHEHLYDGKLNIKDILKRVPNGSYVTFEMKKESKENLDDFKKNMLWLEALY